MQCPYRKPAYYRDLMGAKRFYWQPCGHCVACLHNAQDAWSIRALEETKSHPCFVYDTLTFRPSCLPLADLDVLLAERGSRLEDLSDQSLAALRYYPEGMIPYVGRDVFRDWIRRGRARYRKHHNGKNPKWSYMLFMEYGPKTSRPHAHCLFWNITKREYDLYLGRPWRERFGMTKPSYFNGDSTQKDRDCITRYISKYCSKGVFESPWVKDGILPKPCKSVSNGLGAGYLDSEAFDWFRGPLAQSLLGMSVDKRLDDFDSCFVPYNVDGKRYVRSLLDDGFILEGVSVPKCALDALSVYRDSKGFPHFLPRYYKQKILKLLTPNVCSYKVQNDLLARSELNYRKSLQEFALSVCASEFGTFSFQRESYHLGLPRRLFDLLARRFAFATRVSAKAQLRRCYTRLINHYLRPTRGATRAQYGVADKYLALVC